MSVTEQPPLRAAVPAAEPVADDGWSAPVWVPTRALGRTVLLTGLLLVLGVALGRVDLVLLAAPFAVGAAIGLRRMPRSAPDVAIDADEEHIVEGGHVDAALTVTNPDVIAYDLVVLRTRTSSWLKLENADRPLAVTVPSGGWAAADLPGDALRWGRHDVGPAAARVAACGGLLACRPVVTPARGVRVYPETEPFAAVEAMPAAAGLRCGPATCTWPRRSPTAMPRSCCYSTCSARPVPRAACGAAHRCWTPRSGRPPPSPSTT